MPDQPGQQRASGFRSDSKLLFQEVLEGPRKSVHKLHSTFDLSVALALALGRCFRLNLAVPTILDSVTESNNDCEYTVKNFWDSCILEPHLVASLIAVLKPIHVRQVSPSELLKCFPQFWTHRIPMNSALSFSFIWIVTTYQSHAQF